MAYTMTAIRRKEIKRVKALLKRLENRGYNITIDYEKIHTNKLKHINRVNAVGTYAKYNPLKGAVIERRKKAERKRKSKAKKHGEVVSIDEAISERYLPNGRNIPRSTYHGSEKDREFDTLIRMLEYGEDYTGQKAKDNEWRKARDSNGKYAVQQSAQRIRLMLERAVRVQGRIGISILKHQGDVRHEQGGYDIEKIGKARIIEIGVQLYGSIKKLEEQIERFILAVYDDDYAEWAGGSFLYEYELGQFANALGVDKGSF